MSISFCSSAMRALLPGSCRSAFNHIRSKALSSCNVSNLIGDGLDFASSCSMLARSQIALVDSSVSSVNVNAPHQSLERLENVCSVAQGVNNMVGCAALWTQCFSGSLFYETAPDGSFILTRQAQKGDGNSPNQGLLAMQMRSPLTILSKVCRLVSKTIRVNDFLHEAQLVDLGQHAAGLGGKIGTGAAILSSGFSLVENGLGVYSYSFGKDSKVVDQEEGRNGEARRARFIGLRNAILEFFCDFIDIIREVLGLLREIIPSLLGEHALAVVAILGVIGSALNFVADFIG
ncbi:hypothetical protein [Chlamydia pecorum]|uniref:Uncharacterized protein n=2 Tax=Chlamydia pecorum TaxID=85991 RepID=A0AA34RCS5_CHLPE|nr:hypothetical protein [Chlamydia pecorum]AEB41296.1 conserved hypothetical protein [Chlamydia pecorum E58]UFP06867.1 hypothetical protein KY091_00600 [Chlamydia pecorum]UJT76675.1 hypothetical protein NSWBovSBE_0260 [Chlamydia pecorum]